MAARKSNEKRREKLEQKKLRLLSALPHLCDTLRGSLLKRFVKCGKPTCKCHQGRGHGPYFYLTINYPGGHGICRKISPPHQKQVKTWLNNYAKLKKGLEKIWKVNLELIRLPDESD